MYFKEGFILFSVIFTGRSVRRMRKLSKVRVEASEASLSLSASLVPAAHVFGYLFIRVRVTR